MVRSIQKRALETRARLLSAASELVKQRGYKALRVEEVVLGAGVAKGTFFAHFRDKDALMERLIGARIDSLLDEIEARPAPLSVAALIDSLMPLLQFMTSERYVFDVILRYSGVAAIEEIGPIAMTFERHLHVLTSWLGQAPFRQDIDAELKAEGVQAFTVQAMALGFCALNSRKEMRNRLTTYLEAWLITTKLEDSEVT